MIDSPDILSILVPTEITSDMILSTNVVPEDSNPAWAAGTTYAVGDRVYLASTHRVYESAQASNVGKDPSVPSNRFSAAGAVTWWIDAGPTNQFAMFDGLVSTKTAHAGSITLRLKPGYFNGFALFGIEADDIDVTIRDSDGGDIVYHFDGPLEGSAPGDYYDYFFEPFKPQTQFIATGFDPYVNMIMEITLTSPESMVRLGMLALGDTRPIGAPLRGATAEPIDYSYVSTDDFGNTVVRKRNNATGLTIQAKLDIEDANSVLDAIKQVLGTPVVVIGSQVTMYEALTVFGLVSARMSYTDYREPTINITVKGLT